MYLSIDGNRGEHSCELWSAIQAAWKFSHLGESECG